MRILCPHCDTLFVLDPAASPRRLRRLRCAVCGGGIEPPSRATPRPSPPQGEDAASWRRTLARALVSELRALEPERWRDALDGDRLLEAFAEPLADAWRRYRAEVGGGHAGTFRDAARDVLGEGGTVLPDASRHDD